MADINIKIIHPTNCSDIGLSKDIVLRDVFSELINVNFLSAGQSYIGVLKSSGARKESMTLDNDKMLAENGVRNNDIIQIVEGYI